MAIAAVAPIKLPPSTPETFNTGAEYVSNKVDKAELIKIGLIVIGLVATLKLTTDTIDAAEAELAEWNKNRKERSKLSEEQKIAQMAANKAA